MTTVTERPTSTLVLKLTATYDPNGTDKIMEFSADVIARILSDWVSLISLCKKRIIYSLCSQIIISFSDVGTDDWFKVE
jgi:hypothetical protein